MDIPYWIMTCALASEGFRQWCSSTETHPTACCLGITPDMIIADNYGSRSEMDNVQMLGSVSGSCTSGGERQEGQRGCWA